MMMSIASHYGGGLPFDYIKHNLTMTEVDIAVRVMNDERKREAQRNS